LNSSKLKTGIYENKRFNYRAQRYLIMLMNSIIYKNNEKHAPRFRDVREALKKLIDLKKTKDIGKSMGSLRGYILAYRSC